MPKRRVVDVRFPVEKLRSYYRLPPVLRSPLAELGGNAVQVVDFSAGGLSVVDHSPGLIGDHQLIIEFDEDLFFDCKVRVVAETERVLRLRYMDLGFEQIEAIHRHVLFCQKTMINQIQFHL